MADKLEKKSEGLPWYVMVAIAFGAVVIMIAESPAGRKK